MCMKKLLALLLLTPFVQSGDDMSCDIKLVYGETSNTTVLIKMKQELKKCEENDIFELTIEGKTIFDTQRQLVGWSTSYCKFEESIIIKSNKLACRFRSTEYRKSRSIWGDDI